MLEPEGAHLSLAPPIVAGLVWRPITRDDLAAVVALPAECQLADGGLPFLNEPDNLADICFPDAPGTGIGAFAAGAAAHLVACATVHLAPQGDTERAVIVGQVRPEWRNRGLGTYLLRWSQAQATVSTNNPGAIQTYLALGFATVGRRAKYERIADS